MRQLFVDTNIVIDLLAKQESFYEAAAQLFTLADEGKVNLYVSALTFANTNFIISKIENAKKARSVLKYLKLLVTILDLNGKIVELALNDKGFKDFEDGLQYYTALENEMEIIITRNLKDFKRSKLPVMTSDQFIKI